MALTIPRDFAAAMDLHVGDVVEIEPIDSQRLAVRKARIPQFARTMARCGNRSRCDLGKRRDGPHVRTHPRRTCKGEGRRSSDWEAARSFFASVCRNCAETRWRRVLGTKITIEYRLPRSTARRLYQRAP